jgi:protein O-GlcNAc transferase
MLREFLISMRILLAVLAYALSLSASNFPELPKVNTEQFLPVIRAQIENAAATAHAHPRDASAVATLAMTLHAYQQYDAAARAYEHVHELEPRNFDWLYLLGAVQTELGDLAAAEKSFRTALQLRSGDLTAQLHLAQTLTALSRGDEAAEVYRQILKDHGSCPQAWYGLGRIQAAHGEHAAAAQSFGTACDLYPFFGAAHFARAGELRKLGKISEAQGEIAAHAEHLTDEPPLDDPLFKRIHELNQGVTAHIQRGAALEKAGRLRDAIQEHEAALTADPSDVQVHINLGSLYARVGDIARSKQHLDIAIKLNPGRSDAWYNVGVLLSQQRNYDGAEQAFRRAASINPDYAEAHNNLGALYEQQGRLDDAEKEFGQALASQPNYSLAHFHLGRILVNRQQYAQAIQQFLRALQPEGEQTPVYLYALASTYSRAHDPEHALRYFGKARDAALTRGQSQLVMSIDRDLKSLATDR